MDGQTLWIFILGYSPALSPTPEWMSSFSPCGIRSTITVKGTLWHTWTQSEMDGLVPRKWNQNGKSARRLSIPSTAPVFASPSQAANAKSYTAYAILNSPAQFLSGPVFTLRAVICAAKEFEMGLALWRKKGKVNGGSRG